MVRGGGGLAGIIGAGLALALVAGLAVPASPGGRVEVSGKVALDRQGVAGARVSAYGSLQDMSEARPTAVSEGTDGEGRFTLHLPAGRYYLTAEREARAEGGSGPLFSYHGSNPFYLASGAVKDVSFPLAPRDGAPRIAAGSDPSAATLKGVVLDGGAPAAGVRVKLYLDGESDFRGMGYALSPPTGADGAFQFDFLPGSSYYVVAHRRAGGAEAGPLGEGDGYGFYAGNPVALAGGAETFITLNIAGKGGGSDGAAEQVRPSGATISGRITDGDGAVVPGVYAFAYRDKLMSHAKPDFLSQKVDTAGRYVLRLAEGGTFYIGARARYGDAPARGEWYGRYDGTADHAVTVPPGGKLEGIDIVVERIIP